MDREDAVQTIKNWEVLDAHFIDDVLLVFGHVTEPECSRGRRRGVSSPMKKYFCAPLVNDEAAMSVCQTYWNLRICYGQSREEAFSSCKNLCNNRYSAGSGQSGACLSNCLSMWNRDN